MMVWQHYAHADVMGLDLHYACEEGIAGVRALRGDIVMVPMTVLGLREETPETVLLFEAGRETDPKAWEKACPIVCFSCLWHKPDSQGEPKLVRGVD